MAEVILTRRAVRDLKKLEAATRRTILQKVRLFSESPLRHAKKLTDPQIGTFRYRIGDYRVIFDMDRDKVVVLRLGNRKDIYS